MIRHQATFDADPPAQYDGVFLWDFLGGAFGASIRPMDFDAVVERRGAFLVFETKAPGVPLPTGQRLTLERLVQDRRFTVVFCAKRPEDIDGWEILSRNGRTYMPGDAEALKYWCAAWFDFQNNRAANY